METKEKKARTKSTVAKKDSSTREKAKQTKATKAGVVRPKRTAAEGLRDLFIDGLKDIYWAEKALTKALPKMAKNATNVNLSTAINYHLSVTKEQTSRLEKVFSILGEKVAAKKCDAMEGLIKEGEGMLKETEVGAVRDAAIIAASQKIEHYEIATYGTLAAFARTLGEEEAVALLEKTLSEEKEADVTLTEAAYNTINFDATAGDK